MESHTGTIAHIKHVIRTLPDKIELEKVKAEPEVRKAVGSEVRTIVRDLKDLLLGPPRRELRNSEEAEPETHENLSSAVCPLKGEYETGQILATENSRMLSHYDRHGCLMVERSVLSDHCD